MWELLWFPSGFTICYNLQNSGKSYTYDYSILKMMQVSKTSQIRRWMGKDYRGTFIASLHFKAHHVPLHQCVHQPGSSSEPSQSEFIGVSSQRRDWLSHWPLDWTQSPAPFSSLKVQLAEISSPLITWLVFLVTRLHPEVTWGPNLDLPLYHNDNDSVVIQQIHD